MQVKCKKCGHEWNYKGERKYYIQCPDCRHNINLKKLKDNEEE